MNSLNRTILEKEVVVLRRELMKEEFQDIEQRTVRVLGGFGMHEFTGGSAIFVEFLSDGEKTRFEGYNIDPEETEKWQTEHGQFGEKES